MKNPYLISILLLWHIAVIAQKENKISTIVTTDKGAIEGTTNPTGDIKIFKGIPYAAPPVGDFRWKVPQPFQSWNGIKKCVAFGAGAIQQGTGGIVDRIGKPISEDCLFLNLWTGANTKDEKRAVMVYIHGGAFYFGGGSLGQFDGEVMAKKGVVFVTINYRLGHFGFLAHPELTQETSLHSSGNYAFHDMIAALQWVQRNIASFGGDPNNVTIVGQSAGAFGVNALTSSPIAKGLFHRAIAQSGARFYDSPLRKKFNTLKVAEEAGIAFGNTLGCKSLADLRAKPASDILNVKEQTSLPIIDGYLVTEKFSDIYAKRAQNDVPILVGWNEDEIAAFTTPLTKEQYKKNVESRFGELCKEIFQLYPCTSDEEANRSQEYMMRDEFYAIQSYTWAKEQTRTGKAKAFIYNFNRKGPSNKKVDRLRAYHTDEVAYVFGNLHKFDNPNEDVLGKFGTPWEEIDFEISKKMSAYWINFAKTGNPNGNGLPKWKAYDLKKENVLVIDKVIESKPLPTKKEIFFWEKYFASIQAIK